MKKFQEPITTEILSKKFINQFDLVNYAIRLADNMLKSGRPPRVAVDTDNPAVQVLGEIESGKDQIDEIIIPKENENNSMPTAAASVFSAKRTLGVEIES